MLRYVTFEMTSTSSIEYRVSSIEYRVSLLKTPVSSLHCAQTESATRTIVGSLESLFHLVLDTIQMINITQQNVGQNVAW